MAEEAKIAPAEESKQTEPAKTEAAPKEETVGETLQADKPLPKREEETVPLSAFLELKKEVKDYKKVVKELKEVQKSVEAGATKREVKASVKELSERYNVDESFLQDTFDKMEQEIEERVASKFKPLEDEKKAQSFEKKFDEQFSKVLEAMPEYNGVVNKDVIKSLVIDPRNSQKTLSQIMEQSYGHLLNGKRTIDSSQSRGGSKYDMSVIDTARANKDPEYFKAVMQNPALKKQYNEDLIKRATYL